MVANEFINRSANQDSVFFLLQDLEMTLRREYGKYARNDARTTRKLILSCLIETEGTDCIWYGLDDLRGYVKS